MASKVTYDMIKPFTGEGDVVSWIMKVKLVAKLQKITDVASLIPLYLEGDALAIYLEMKEKDQADADKIEATLKEAFTDGPFVAHGKLSRMRWTGEQVDVYANEIRRLAGLAGFTGDGLERMVKLTFVNGLPDSISVELQQVENILSLPMSDILTRARVLTANKEGKAIAAVATSARMMGKGDNAQGRKMASKQEERKFKGQCYVCGGPHMARQCTERKPVTCYKCGKEGHISPQCYQGNEMRGTGAPAVTPLMD